MRIPVIPTIVVLVACGIMVSLGVWQLGRADEKAELIARYEAAQSDQTPYEWFAESDGRLYDVVPFPYSRIETRCHEVLSQSSRAGRNDQGRSGWTHYANCLVAYGESAEFALGWSTQPGDVGWSGGPVTGTIMYDEDWRDWRLVADPPLAGLEANAKPNPNDLPNNHLSYAVQWFLFALTALVIYILALRRRARSE